MISKVMEEIVMSGKFAGDKYFILSILLTPIDFQFEFRDSALI